MTSTIRWVASSVEKAFIIGRVGACKQRTMLRHSHRCLGLVTPAVSRARFALQSDHVWTGNL